MNPVFKNLNIFLAQKSIFSEKNFEKLKIFYRNFWCIRIIIWKISIFMKPINPEKFSVIYYLVQKFTVAAPGIFSGVMPWPLKGYQAPPQGVWRRRPPDGREVSFLKSIHGIWKWIHFTKKSTFFFPKT